jgi:hypothetical protein
VEAYRRIIAGAKGAWELGEEALVPEPTGAMADPFLDPSAPRSRAKLNEVALAALAEELPDPPGEHEWDVSRPFLGNAAVAPRERC